MKAIKVFHIQDISIGFTEDLITHSDSIANFNFTGMIHMLTEVVTKDSLPLVSICLPVYNAVKYLPNVFKCFSSQTYKNTEIVIVDDGSVDGSGDLAKQLLKSHELNGQVISSTNHGPEQARDLCCAYANGKIIAPFDADDLWLPNYIEVMVQVLIDNPDIDLVYCDFIEEFQDTGKQVSKSSRSPWIDLGKAEQRQTGVWCFSEKDFFPMLLQGQVIFPPCSMFRKEIYDQVDGYSRRLPEMKISLDWWFGLRVSAIGSIAYQLQPLLIKYRHDNNISGNSVITAKSDVLVLETLLEDSLIPEDMKHFAYHRASVRAMDAAYGLFADENNNPEARHWLRKSLKHKFSLRGIKIYLSTLAPVFMLKAIRSLRH